MGRESEFLLAFAVGRFMGQAGDHRTVDAQIVQIAGGQRVEFTQGLTVDRTAGAVFLHPLNRVQQAATQASLDGGVLCLSDNSHDISFHRLVRRPARMARRFVGIKMDLMLQLHNPPFRQCCHAADA